jgi:hypothetical protein
LFTGQAQRFISAGIAPLTTETSFWVSMLLLAIWIGGLIGLALVMFQRQELTE